MRPEELVARLRETLGTSLRSVLLYGSAAGGDYMARTSDYNTLVILNELNLDILKALSTPTRAWIRAGNPAPLLFTVERLERSADVFPIELLDIKDCHRVLFGEDVTLNLSVSRDNLRLELEHELKGKLIQLRQRYVSTGGKSKAVQELMVQSLSTFLVLFRGVLRLFEDNVPSRKMDALSALGKHLEYDQEVFATVDALRRGDVKPRDVDVEGLFARYLRAIEEVVDRVDGYLRKPGEKENA